ncbi:MAG: CHAT domain-containing protein [Thermoanaerobaculia bacterium]
MEALTVLRQEERANLERDVSKNAEFWSAYFSRFQNTYHWLIRHYLARNNREKAFEYAERARAYEILDLLRRGGKLPAGFEAEPKTLRQIQAALPNGTFILAYTVLEELTYTWIVSRDTFELLEQNARRADIGRWTDDVQTAVHDRDRTALGIGLTAPYVQLIEQPLARIRKLSKGATPRLVIVPDGALHGLPFAGLRSLDQKFLIEEAVIEVHGSATLYTLALERDRLLSTVKPSILLFGNPAFDPMYRLPQLTRADEEVQQIAGFYGDATVRTGKAATVAEFWKLVPRHSILHIAAHAVASARTPSNSEILLAKSESDSGSLDAKELLENYRQFGQTKLVVLSACSSAGGHRIGPEGVGALVRPFIAAGVPAVIGSLWDVNDATAERLMVSFHRAYEQGSDAAAALRTAQLELLRGADPGQSGSVLEWAPFQVIGHGSSPNAPTSN